MAESASPPSIRVSAAAARLVRQGTKEEKMRVARGEGGLPPVDLLAIFFFFCSDPDRELRAAAVAGLRQIPEEEILSLLEGDFHPRLLDFVARVLHASPAVVAAAATHPALSPETLAFLQQKGVLVAEAEEDPAVAITEPEPEADAEPLPEEDGGEKEEAEEEGEEFPEETDEFRSKYQLAQSMGVGEKIKMALTGDKEWRGLLIKDSNKLVNSAVVKNPRITEQEVLTIAKSAVQNDEILRIICMNKEWLKNYQIKKALALNNKTPLPNALRYLGAFTEKDLAAVAKSKNVSSVIATQARKLLLGKQKK